MFPRLKAPSRCLTALSITALTFGLLGCGEDSGADPSNLENRLDQMNEMVDQGSLDEISDSAKKEIAESVSGADATDSKREAAMDAFSGFMLANTEIKRRICDDLGVDLSPFLKALNDAHASEIQALKSFGYDSKVILNALVSEAQALETATRVARADMEATAKRLEGSVRDTCNLYNQSGREIAELMHFSKINPEAHAYIY